MSKELIWANKTFQVVFIRQISQKKRLSKGSLFWKISLRRCENFINFNELTNPFPCIYQILSIPKIIVFLEVLSGAPIELIELSTDSAGFFWISISYKKRKMESGFFSKNWHKTTVFFFW